MTHVLKTAALALAISLIGGAALACGPDGCGKDKDGKMECCCDKMKGDHAMPGKSDGAKPDAKKPAAPQGAEHKH